MRYTLLLFTFFVCFQSFSQQSFIEVNVSDTVLVEPDIFVYRLTVLPNDEIENDELRYKNPDAFKKKIMTQQSLQQKRFDSLKLAIKRIGFAVLPESIQDVYIHYNQEYNLFSLDIWITSLDSLNFLYNQIKNNNLVVGSLELYKAKDETIAYKNLYAKLIAKAQKNAELIATNSNKKLVSIFSVTENKVEEDKGGWTAYPPLSSWANTIIPGWHTTIKGRNNLFFSDKEMISSYSIERSLIVRFLME